MRILIVNAHSIKGKAKFEFFVNSIMNVCPSILSLIFQIIQDQKELVDIENEFHLRDKDNLDDFLYEEESSYVKKVLLIRLELS